MCFVCVVWWLSVQVSTMLNINYNPDPETDFSVLEKMMTSIEKRSESCKSLQSIYDRVDKYTDTSYSQRVRYTAGMAQAMTQYYRPELCTIRDK